MPRAQKSVVPVLRLRPTVPTECITAYNRAKRIDGPWLAHPELIQEKNYFENFTSDDLTLNTTMNNYRGLWKAEKARTRESLKSVEKGDIRILSVVQMAPSINMESMLGKSDEQITREIERLYVGPSIYLIPRSPAPPGMIDRFRSDWSLNAQGIYYRHYYSPGWVTAGRTLWLPSLQDKDWDHHTEQDRRTRARAFLKHNLENETRHKSEYAWDADAWTDVFGKMRDDPLVAADKHDYNTIGCETDELSCLLNGKSKMIKRTPDATFGLTTFRSSNDEGCTPVLGHINLDAMLLNRHTGLQSDPNWGGVSLAFPFAAYEAKGWSGDPRVARRQVTSAGAVYLDMLDKLTRQPGAHSSLSGVYQTDQSHNNQVFCYTSFGSHWHVLVGYKRPRLKREHAQCAGMSESVYVFQRIWSGRVTTERRAWELLSFVDQIHQWGITAFRDYVTRHLKVWHEYTQRCILSDVGFMLFHQSLGFTNIGFVEENGSVTFQALECCLQLPAWTQHLSKKIQDKLKRRAAIQLATAYEKIIIKSKARCENGRAMQTWASEARHSSQNQGYSLADFREIESRLFEIFEDDEIEMQAVLSKWEELLLVAPRTEAKPGERAVQSTSFAEQRGQKRKRAQDDKALIGLSCI